jgi:hypothetical protein
MYMMLFTAVPHGHNVAKRHLYSQVYRVVISGALTWISDRATKSGPSDPQGPGGCLGN